MQDTLSKKAPPKLLRRQSAARPGRNRRKAPKQRPRAKNRAEKLSGPGKESLPRNGGQNRISPLATVLPSFCRANRSPPAVPPLRTESRSPSKDWLT